MASRNIPTEAEFERASAIHRERYRGLGDLSEKVLMEFRPKGFLHEFFMFASSENKFFAHVFYRLTSQIEEAEKNGISQEIIDYVNAALKQAGRTGTIKFEFSSHEIVRRVCGGDYFTFLR